MIILTEQVKAAMAYIRQSNGKSRFQQEFLRPFALNVR